MSILVFIPLWRVILDGLAGVFVCFAFGSNYCCLHLWLPVQNKAGLCAWPVVIVDS